MNKYMISAFLVLFVFAQTVSSQSLDLTVKNTGISFGDSPRINGIRFNYRDSNMRKVNGVNVTLWQPYEPAQGAVNGIALGLPSTGAKEINGAAIGVLGVAAEWRY